MKRLLLVVLLCVVASFGLKYGARFYRIGTMSWTKRNFLTRSNLRDVVLLLSFMSTVFFGITTGEVIVGFLLLALGCFVHFLSKGVLVRNTVLTRRGIYNIVRHPYYLSNFVCRLWLLRSEWKSLFALDLPFPLLLVVSADYEGRRSLPAVDPRRCLHQIPFRRPSNISRSYFP